MRHAIGWADLADRRVGLWGLGVEGRANLAALRAIDVEPVIVADDVTGEADGETVLGLAEGGLDALGACEVVVKSPGVSRNRSEVAELESTGVAVVGGLGLWLEGVDRTRVVAVTGTKGKSTTSSVLAHLLRGLGVSAEAGGNIGAAPWHPDAPRPDRWVIEVSSYQATDVASSPGLVVVTSLAPDHLPWHGGEEAYYADKLSLCHQPGARRSIAPADDVRIVARADQLGPAVTWVTAPVADELAWAEPLGLRGVHNVRNAALARAALLDLDIDGADDDARLRTAAEGYVGLPSRLEPAGSVDGVDFVDDSLSTNVLPALAAVAAFPDGRLALIAGGHDRGIDYDELAEGLAGRAAPTAAFTVGPAGARIAEAVRAAGGSVDLQECADLPDATEAAWRWARPEGTVLLSPAAASFGEHRNYADRAAAFRHTIAHLQT
jgi:UDP-N-acetylmuramoylalanine--D-glutamate ligase